MGVATAVAVVGMVAGVGAGAAGVASANRTGKNAATKRETLEGAIKDQRDSMQDIKNPFANMSNQYANLAVATQASKFQAQEADVALANTLDTLRATGAGAGGATALAQAALKSKQGISANLEQQEIANEKLKAQGAMDVQAKQMAGEQWVWEQQNEREMMDLDRSQAQIDQERLIEAEAQQAKNAMFGTIASSLIGGTGNISSAITGSDRRLKRDIKLISYSPSGLKVYSFKYKDIKYGEGYFQGVMSDEIPSHAVIKNSDGYDMVNYSLIDVDFRNI
jgi:hypothetical protein